MRATALLLLLAGGAPAVIYDFPAGATDCQKLRLADCDSNPRCMKVTSCTADPTACPGLNCLNGPWHPQYQCWDCSVVDTGVNCDITTMSLTWEGCVENPTIPQAKDDFVEMTPQGGSTTKLDKILTQNEIPAWKYGNKDASLVDIPGVMLNGHFYKASNVPAFTNFKGTCKGAKSCTMYVAHYHCPGCTGPTNGDLPAVLPPNQWESASCAPKMKVGGEKYPMVAYRKDGFWERRPDRRVRHGQQGAAQRGIFLVRDEHYCDGLGKSDCSGGSCTWQDNQCVYHWCQKKKPSTPGTPGTPGGPGKPPVSCTTSCLV
eukprot:Sspe_Gene.28573::Locus_13059_Transcript_1_2_Confidence_0.667_Length_1164::g.28573::m.28573